MAVVGCFSNINAVKEMLFTQSPKMIQPELLRQTDHEEGNAEMHIVRRKRCSQENANEKS